MIQEYTVRVRQVYGIYRMKYNVYDMNTIKLYGSGLPVRCIPAARFYENFCLTACLDPYVSNRIRIYKARMVIS